MFVTSLPTTPATRFASGLAYRRTDGMHVSLPCKPSTDQSSLSIATVSGGLHKRILVPDTNRCFPASWLSGARCGYCPPDLPTFEECKTTDRKVFDQSQSICCIYIRSSAMHLQLPLKTTICELDLKPPSHLPGLVTW